MLSVTTGWINKQLLITSVTFLKWSNVYTTNCIINGGWNHLNVIYLSAESRFKLRLALVEKKFVHEIQGYSGLRADCNPVMSSKQPSQPSSPVAKYYQLSVWQFFGDSKLGHTFRTRSRSLLWMAVAAQIVPKAKRKARRAVKTVFAAAMELYTTR